jgi:hypothetical protein
LGTNLQIAFGEATNAAFGQDGYSVKLELDIARAHHQIALEAGKKGATRATLAPLSMGSCHYRFIY